MTDKDNFEDGDENVTIYTESTRYYKDFRSNFSGRRGFVSGRSLSLILLFLLWSLILGVITNIGYAFKFIVWVLGGIF